MDGTLCLWVIKRFIFSRTVVCGGDGVVIWKVRRAPVIRKREEEEEVGCVIGVWLSRKVRM